MATLTAEQIAEARKEGYSDDEILQHYAQANQIDVKAAHDEGYSTAEILSHISGADVQPQEQKVQVAPVQSASNLSNPALSAALGAGAGAMYSAKTLPVKAAKALGGAFAEKLRPLPEISAPAPDVYRTPSGIPVEQTPGGLHPGAVGNAQFNVEQQQANTLRQNMPSGFEQRGTSRIITPVGMEESAAALGGGAAPSTERMSTINRLRREGWPIVREGATQAIKSTAPVIGSHIKGAVTSHPAAGAIAGWNLQEAENRSRAGDTTGATIGYAGAGSQLIPKMKGKLGLVKPLIGLGAAGINALRGKPEGYADGHLVRNKKDLALEGLKALKNIVVPTEPKIIRASEALAPHEGKYLGLTQTDNFGVHGERMGGNQFPAFQQTRPKHAEDRVVWMNDSEKHANDIIKASHSRDKPMIWSTYIGAPDQLKSNKTVTQDIYDQFLKGNWTPEQYAAINNRIATLTKGKDKPLVYPQAFDIRDKFAAQELGMDTFERRGALASLLGMGEGTRKGKQYMGMPEYQDILSAHRDPLTEGVPTSSVGTRLFEVDPTPSRFSQEYHPDYNWTVHGQDQGVSFKPVEQGVMVPDWYNEYKSRFPKLEPHGNAWFSYMKQPQQITEDYLRGLEEAGHAEGGRIQHMAAGKLAQAGGLSMLPEKQVEDMTQMERKYNYLTNRPAYQKAEMLGEALSGMPELAASFHPGFGLGYAGASLYDAATNTGDYLGAAGDTLFNAPGVLRPIGAGIKAAAPIARAALPIAGGLGMLGASQAAEAGPTSPMKGIINNVMEGFAPKAAKRIEAGAPHTYGPQATGSWMRDYQPSGTGLPSTPEEWNMLAQARQAAQNQVDYSMGRTGPVKPDLVQYWGKYRKGTPEERAAQRQSDIDTIKMLQKLRGMDDYAAGGEVQGYAGGKLVRGAMDMILPAAENAAKTQRSNTVPTYLKAAEHLTDVPGRILDFSAGKGLGAEAMSQKLGKRIETYEPFAQGWNPDYSKLDASDVPTAAFGGLTNLNSLNVVPREVRDQMVLDMGRSLEPGGRGIITTRGNEVMNTKGGRPGPEPSSIITGIDTYQKGFTNPELEEYLKYMLGDQYDINRLKLGPAGALIKKK